MTTIGKIYKIYSQQTNKIYIGSTTKLLLQRFLRHKKDYRLYNNGKFHFVTSFHILEYDDCNIELIEEVEFDDKKELIRRERFHIENSNCVNKIVPGRTTKEYHQANKEKILEYNKEYNKANKERISEQAKQKINCSCGSVVRKDNIKNHQRTKKHIKYLESLTQLS